ncbi:Pol Polyprotein [Phytophthora megakarya]|uniref:Pol Polyprotein n=1 Tax=Phytophthora megakarya TaxID=4795 RepID=A0A225VTN8_9STRA|nr:Pol Polyprotein [Phytophthora megakarya]
MSIDTGDGGKQGSSAHGLVESAGNEDDELNAGEELEIQPADLVPKHLEAALKHSYLKLLEKHHTLYSGRLGRIRLDDYILPVSTDYVPSHAKPYSVPRSQEDAARREIQRLLQLDVLEQIYDSESAAPAFFLQKSSGELRLLVDFRRLNKYLRRSPYFVPKIREILLRLGKAKCMSTLDANMGYFARRLALQSRSFTSFCLPWGKFQFKRLPMGISTAPDEYQACMERILGDLPYVIVYLDDILIFSENEIDHLEHLAIVFKRLQTFDVTLNAKKCRILRESVNYLGFTLTPDGIQPQANKVEAIQQIAEPANKKELRRFLGIISYYREMVPNKSALTARLNRLTSKNVPGRQIGGLIIQGKRIIACFSRSLTETQRKYSTMDWELLSVVEILKEYRTMLLGFPIVIHTDHKNLLYPQETSLRIKRWKLLLEEYRLSVEYVAGSQNVGADAFSRL